MFYIKRVYINYLFTTMQKEFITGLKLKNSLSNQLVTSFTIEGIIYTHGRQKRQVVHMRAHRLLQQPHGTCQVPFLTLLETTCATIWSVESWKTISDTTFSTVWTSQMLMIKSSTNQTKKASSISSLQENGKAISLKTWRICWTYFSQLGVLTPDYITRVT